MVFYSDGRLERFILSAQWEDFPLEVQERALTCTVDLMNALILGSQSEQFKVGLAMAKDTFRDGECAIVGSTETMSTIGAAISMGHASNAYDIDDGHNMIRAHPGTSFIGALLAVAYEQDCNYEEFLTALIISYETTIRIGIAIMDFYQHPHSSGTFGAPGSVAGVARLRGYSQEMLQTALSIAEFHAPLVPGGRSVEYPSMNKDGVPFGVMVGMLSLAEAEHGFEGSKHLLEAEDYAYLLDDLTKNYEIMNLYFKPYSCCRWGHPAIEAVLEVMREEALTADKIESIILRTFERATKLSKGIPGTADEAQYNIAYPVAAALVWGDVGMAQLTTEAFEDSRVHRLMEKIFYEIDPEMDKAFPAKRQCQAVIKTINGRTITSSVCEPRGEAQEGITIEWVEEKFLRMTGDLMPRERQEDILNLLRSPSKINMREIVHAVNACVGLIR